eukprot:TRINITY_DN907_c5_g1_i1.p1 TRINITY_DN907_c5_g1~~TRINITY_DN907_c5_g1_i1.p1  ORF type:complete len:566 (+),score=256.29 TRINITY_DN907_c5_g1_i1:198-1700(+)
MEDLVVENNHSVNMPRLTPYDGFGNRTEAVTFASQYHEVGRRVYASGVMSNYKDVGREFESLVQFYLMGQNSETGHQCPLACTAGLIKSLQAEPNKDATVQFWLQKLLNPDYDNHFHGSQFMTEVQGGSDVGANTLRATRSNERDGWYELWGEKWFCSVVDAQLWLVVARPEGAGEGTKGLKGFVVPRNVKEGQVNRFRVRRLKEKLGTRTMASGEVDFMGTLAYPLAGDFRQVLSLVINTSRLYNAVGCAGSMQRCYKEAASYAANRLAFGTTLVDFPAVRATVARLNSEAHGARAACFFLADINDRMRLEKIDDKQLTAAVRMLVNMNKYWTAEVALKMSHEAIDVLGGNGAIEEFSALPRLLRDGVVLAQWEGPHNTLCAQILKDSKRLGLHKPMFAFLRTLGQHDRLDTVASAWDHLLTLPEEQASVGIRHLVDQLRPVVHYLLLKREAGATGSATVSAAAEHLLAITAPGHSPVTDAGFLQRIRVLAGESLKSKL